jgi:hypothetical protein
MDNAHDLPPEDLDALLDGLQKGKQVTLPNDQKPEGEFLGRLVDVARDVQLDDGYAARLEKHLRYRRPRIHQPMNLQKSILVSRLQRPWRYMAMALCSLTLVIVLGLSSFVGSHISKEDISPTLPGFALDGLYAGNSSLSLTTQSGAMSSPQARHDDVSGTLPVQIVQAPSPPHTPLPSRNTQDSTLLSH